jgi:hypothetical protein
MSAEIRIVASLAGETEADIVVSRLRAAGIEAMPQRKLGGPEYGSLGSHDVYVNVRDLERARALLATDEEPFSDEELTRLSEQAYREAREH